MKKYRLALTTAIILSTLFSATMASADDSLPPRSPKVRTTLPPAPNASGEYGQVKFKPSEAVPVSATSTQGDVVIKTIVSEVCPKKGCWMKIKGATNGEDVRVTFKDYGFFVPTELVGKEVALKGRYTKHVESIEEQKHLLQDSKRPQAEIDAVTKPKETIRFVATGVKELTPGPK